jgi:hypothetical protein
VPENVTLTPEQLEWLQSLPMSKRAAIVRDHILTHGHVTTADLNALGYDHPPRAVRDLRDAGAGVKTVMIVQDGKRMASYVFDGTSNEDGSIRVNIPKKFADDLKAAYDNKCAVCSGAFASRMLQADHRIPFAIAGDKASMAAEDFMPLCAPDNRAKSWSCEHCPNWVIRDPATCATCFWAHPENYDHVETRPERRLSLTFQGSAVAAFDSVAAVAAESGQSMPEYIADVIRDTARPER